MRISGDFAPIWEHDLIDGSDSASLRLGGQSPDGLDHGDDRLSSPPAPTANIRATHDGVRNTDPYFVAGHDPGDSLPSSAFPHAAGRDEPRDDVSSSRLAAELACLNPPLYAQPRSWTDGVQIMPLPRQHASVMNSILHVSLLRGDYVRAGQAFGMLLRASSGNSAIAIRTNGNWGIGAEILLRQRPDTPALPAHYDHDNNNDSEDNVYHDRPPEPDPSVDLPTLSLSAVKDYYESLILQYPYIPTNPHPSIDARTFYPAFFGLLIHEATETSRLAQQRLASESPDSNADDLTAIKRTELRAARAIASRIDDLIVSPQYDRFAPLLRLRGMVALWMADLTFAIVGEREISDGDEEDDGNDERAEALRIAAMERIRARTCFERCVQAGGEVPAQLMNR